MTRVETYLDSLANMEDGPDYPEVTRTRVENYLDAICKNVGRRKTMPTPGPKYKGKIVQYVGETTDTYTQGYFYKCTGEDSYSSTVTFANNKISCTGANFLAFIKDKFPTNFTEIVSGTMLYYTAADLWAFDGKNSDGTVIAHYQQYTDDFEEEGFVFTGTFRDEETIGFTCSTTVTPGTYTWNQINVQPGGGVEVYDLPASFSSIFDEVEIGDDLEGQDVVNAFGSITVMNEVFDAVSNGQPLKYSSEGLEVILKGSSAFTSEGEGKMMCITFDAFGVATVINGRGYAISFNDNVSDAYLLCYDTSEKRWGDIEGTLSDQTDLQTALNAKQATLVSGTNIKTINNNSILGSGNITIESGEQLIFSVENDGSGIIQMTSSNISSIAKAVLEGKKGEQSSIIVGKKPVDGSYAYGPKVLNMIQLNVNTTYVIASFAGYSNNSSNSYYEILGIKYRDHTYLGYDFYIPRAEYDSGNITHIYGDSELTSTSINLSRLYSVFDVVDAIFNGPLSSNNTSSYTPTGDYNPATKKYVDDAVGNIETALTTIISGGGVQ